MFLFDPHLPQLPRPLATWRRARALVIEKAHDQTRAPPAPRRVATRVLSHKGVLWAYGLS